jgi:hypothetical protein
MARYPLRLLSIASAGYTLAQTATSPPPGQPLKAGAIGQFELIGNSLVSAQQIFVGTPDKLYIIDKTENNPAQINGHPAWASEFSISSAKQRTMDAVTNTFCAGGNVLGNGTWLNVGGNQAVTYGGLDADSQTGGGPYDDPDGGKSIRLLNPCDDSTCDWTTSLSMTTRRWYPTVETLEDGTMIILGGCLNGGYVNDAAQDNPTYEFFPSRGKTIPSPLLQRTLPTNLYPLTWLLPSGKLFLQSNRETVLLDYKTDKESPLDDMPNAVRTYPASAGTIMMPLTPANNWTATIMFCGGSDIANDRWSNQDWNIAAFPASTSCVRITPDASKSYTKDDPLPEGRSMANLIFLPDGRILCLNGAKTGTAGYGNTSWAIGQSYANHPALTPVIYDPNAAAGSRWSRDGLSASTVPRMYHSSATLLPDGSVFVGGSNPNSDYNVGEDITFPTEYRVEKFYPSYYNQRRPQPSGLLKQLNYGGPVFDVYLGSEDLFGDVQNVKNASVVVLRTGFSTHSMNMGQRYVQLESSYTGFDNNTAVLHVRPLPPNPSILVPGPAFLFVVVKGVPSIGVPVMVGSGQLGKQDALPTGDPPSSSIVRSSEAPADVPPKNAGSRISWDVDWFALASSLLFLSLHLEW